MKRILIGAVGLMDEPVANHLRGSGFTVRFMVRDIAKVESRIAYGGENIR